MRFLKRIIISVLIYMAVYLPFVVSMSAFSGVDMDAAYAAGGISGCVELALGAAIEIVKHREGIDRKKETDGQENTNETNDKHGNRAE